MAGIKKPTIYVLNVSESDLKQDFNLPFKHVKVSAKLEVELSELSKSDQKDYLRELGIDLLAHAASFGKTQDKSSGQASSGLNQVVIESYKLLNLITFF